MTEPTQSQEAPTAVQGTRPTHRPTAKPGIHEISPYVPGKAKAEGVENPVKLSANENILGSSPKAREAFIAASEHLGLYPDGRGEGLRAAVAGRYDLEPERLILGCGTDEIFALLNQTFLEPGDNIVQGEFGFGAYAIGARANQGEVRFAPEPNYRIDVDAMLAQVDERTRLMFIANPANPTGTFITDAEMRRLHEALPPAVLLVIDGAYAEFNTDPDLQRRPGSGAGRREHRRHPHLLQAARPGRPARRLGLCAGAMWPTRSTASACRSTPRSPARRPPSPPWPTRTSRRSPWPWWSNGGRG